MFQALAAISYVHSNSYMHRDIKPENFLISHKPDGSDEFKIAPGGTLSSDSVGIKLADFGLAKELKRHNLGNHTEYVSTRWYRAPELVLRSQNYNERVDVFALGAIMGELYLGRPLFPGTSESDQLTRIITVLGTPQPSDWPEGHQLAQQKGIKFPQVMSSGANHFR